MYTFIKLVLNCHTNRPYASCGRDFFFKHPFLVISSRGEPQSTTVKVVTALFSKTLKRIQKKPVFGHFWKTQWVKLAKYYLKSTTRPYWIWISFYFYWKTLFLTYFLVYCKFLSYQYGSIVCPFIVVLKHKCSLLNLN